MKKTNKDIAIRKQIAPIIEQVTALAITDTKSITEASSLLSDIDARLEKITLEKERVTKPLNEALKAERSRWKPLEEALDDARIALRLKMTAYQTRITRERIEAEAAIASRIGTGSGHLKLDTAMRQIDNLDTPPAAITTDTGTLKFREQKRFEVTSLADLPLEYHLPDETAIRKAMLAGITLSGVRYFVEQVPINSRN